MELTYEDVAALLDVIERSKVDYLELEVGGTRIVADRSGTTTAARSAASAAASAAAPVATTAAAAAPVAPAATPAPAAAPAAAPAPADRRPAAAGTDGDLVTVTAPMVGTFYRSPEPGAPAFVEVGSSVTEGATMALVEVMKMFNSVSAPASGQVVEVLAGNDEFVEYGQPLFRLRPAVA